MQESGIRIVDGIIYAPEGINKFLKRSWELLLKTGKPYNSNTPPSTSSEESEHPTQAQPEEACYRPEETSKQTANW